MAENPQIDFYILERGRAERVACLLAEKAFLQGMTVFIRTGDSNRTGAMDELLWTFRQDSFVPHGREAEAGADVPVRLGEDRPAAAVQLVINLARDCPPGQETYERIAEIVGPSTDEKSAGRTRFRHYRDTLGCDPAVHRLGGEQ